jgi:phage terminase small subunit
MAPPSHFSERWKRIWRQTFALLQSRGAWRDDKRPFLDEYVAALREATTAREAAEGNPYPETDRGTVQAHPGFAQADRAARRAVALAGALGLDQETTADASDFDALDEDELATRRARRKR